jgi:sugar phosphate isomerase/epimerase
MGFALQLYTVRDFMEKDPETTLRQVKAVGYDFVELAGLCDLGPEAFKALLDANGLTAMSMHAGYERITGNLDGVIAEARIFGMHYVVVPWVGGPMCPDRAAWLDAARAMDAAGAHLREQGLQLCYHNHAHEFERVEGDVILDLLYENTAPENLAVELDTCWASIGGSDPVDLIRKYAGRMPLLHVKDYVASQPPQFAEVGRGCMDWPAIFAAARQAGVEWYVVEQDDHFAVNSLESARTSAAYMAASGV